MILKIILLPKYKNCKYLTITNNKIKWNKTLSKIFVSYSITYCKYLLILYLDDSEIIILKCINK